MIKGEVVTHSADALRCWYSDPSLGNGVCKATPVT